ncbi:hypothetical protein AQUCO_02600092v1 [Aquilegia coerulea]|uniref:Uncharacterized protein n=1 Tax=Aquilegia coerulea TaxID=218851 RepID=A0A2G5D7B4_AQUCA|nr:hypothetical protein AQUCO_02600092v1 [Aquilegia coerulea]
MAKKKTSSQQQQQQQENIPKEITNHQKRIESTTTTTATAAATTTRMNQNQNQNQNQIQIQNQNQNQDSGKLAHLKSLNSLLLKETVEKREQVDSLLKSKKELEIEIDLLKKQSDETQIQKSVMVEFVNQEIEQQKEQIWREKDELKGLLDEKIRQIDQVSCDFQRYRDDVEKDLGLKDSEIVMLKSSVVDLEKNNEVVKKEIERVGFEKDGVLEKKNELEKRIVELSREIVDVVKGREEIEKVKLEQDAEIEKLNKSVDVLNADLVSERGNLEKVVNEKDKIIKSLDVLTKEMERVKVQVLELEKCNSATEMELGKLRDERRGLMDERKEREIKFEGFVKEKAVIEQERAKEGIKIAGLEKEVERLQAALLNVQKEEENLRSVVVNLEKMNVEALEKQEQIQLEVDTLLGEKTEIQKSFELLMEERNSISKSLETATVQLEIKESKMVEIVNEKAAIEKLKNDKEVEIDNLHKQVFHLQSVVSTLEESCREQVEANAKVQAEARQYKDELKSVTVERDNVRNEMMWKAKEEERLKSEVLELEKRVVETKQELQQARIEQCHLSEEKEEMKACIETLTEDKGELQRMLVKAEEGIDDFQAKIKLSETSTGQALQMLKRTVELVCHPEDAETGGKEELAINSDEIDEQIQPFAAELETIRKAFKNKNGNVEDMNRQFESLKLSIVQAQKKKNIWAWLSSVSFVAGAVVAYAARVH